MDTDTDTNTDSQGQSLQSTKITSQTKIIRL